MAARHDRLQRPARPPGVRRAPQALPGLRAARHGDLPGLVPPLRRDVQLGVRLHGLQARRQHQRRARLRAAPVREHLRHRLVYPVLRGQLDPLGDSSTPSTRRASADEQPAPDHGPVPERRRAHHLHHHPCQPLHRGHLGLLCRRTSFSRSRTVSPSAATTCRRPPSGDLRDHRAVGLRRLPLLDRLPGRLARGAAPRRGDAAQLRSLHDGRPARLPDAPPPGPARGGDLDRRRLDLLPARQMVGAGTLVALLLGVDSQGSRTSSSSASAP